MIHRIHVVLQLTSHTIDVVLESSNSISYATEIGLENTHFVFNSLDLILDLVAFLILRNLKILQTIVDMLLNFVDSASPLLFVNYLKIIDIIVIFLPKRLNDI